ncbi:MAG: DUF72 domain-containing protein, partial [Pseudomonadota bacterium]
DLPQDEWLAYYAQQLPTVEINNTFYRMPREHVVQAWHDAVPRHFRFVIKASRRITHQSRLKNAEEATGYLVKRAAVLGEKLGAVLFQLPPNMRMDAERLETFIALLPNDFPAAFEFRHDSWACEEIDDILARHNHTRVVSHDDDSNNRRKIQLPASDLHYVRLRATSYSPAILKKWHTALSTGANHAKKRQAFVFFKHEDDGYGPVLAKQFLDLSAKLQTTQTAASRTVKPALRAPRRVPARPAKKSG